MTKQKVPEGLKNSSFPGNLANEVYNTPVSPLHTCFVPYETLCRGALFYSLNGTKTQAA